MEPVPRPPLPAVPEDLAQAVALMPEREVRVVVVVPPAVEVGAEEVPSCCLPRIPWRRLPVPEAGAGREMPLLMVLASPELPMVPITVCRMPAQREPVEVPATTVVRAEGEETVIEVAWVEGFAPPETPIREETVEMPATTGRVA